MDRDQQTSQESEAPEPTTKPLIKRRWAIMSKAGGGVAVIAIAGALALSDPSDQGDYGDDAGGAGPQVTAES